MRFSNHQRGAGLAGWLILVLVFGLFLTVGSKLLPVYMDYRTIASVLDKVGEEDGVAGKTRKNLMLMITKKLKINSIRDFNVRENLRVETTEDGRNLILEYEERVPLFKNLDLIASFKKEVRLRR